MTDDVRFADRIRRTVIAVCLFALGSLLFTAKAQRGGGPPAPVRRLILQSATARRSLQAKSCTTKRARRVTGRTVPAASSGRQWPRRIADIFAAPTKRSSTSSRTAIPARRCRRIPGSSPRIRSGSSPRISADCAGPPSTRQRRAMSQTARPSSGRRATCGTCHMVKGKGSILGPDLSNLGGTRKGAEHRRCADEGKTQDRR